MLLTHGPHGKFNLPWCTKEGLDMFAVAVFKRRPKYCVGEQATTNVVQNDTTLSSVVLATAVFSLSSY